MLHQVEPSVNMMMPLREVVPDCHAEANLEDPDTRPRGQANVLVPLPL